MLALLLFAAPAAAQDDASDLGGAVAEILAAKCGECHVPESENKRARKSFDAARDLPRVVSDFVAPGDLAFSDLWAQVELGDMPPEDAAAGPLSAGELETIKAWILAGAPLQKADESTPTVSAPAPLPPPERSAALRTLSWLGRMHPAVVHFPIALLAAAALAELLLMATGAQWLAGATRFSILLSAPSALLAGTLGWLNTEYGTVSDPGLETHKWWGVATLVLASLLLVLSEARHRRTDDGLKRTYRAVLFVAAAVVFVTGHLGGVMVFGEGYLEW